MEEEYYRQLVKRYLEGHSTDAELEVFVHLIKEGKLDIYLKEALNEEAAIDPEDELIIETIRKKRNIIPSWLKYTAAAILLLSVFSVFYLHSRPAPQQLVKTKILKNDAMPGGNKAILTLANGSKIILNDIRNGKIAKQGSTSINKVQDGNLVYQPSAGNDSSGIAKQGTAYNTISTPKAGQY
ncbi:MAG TPA: hypothetical protein VGC08_15265, partial [Pedobacter sp.]